MTRPALIFLLSCSSAFGAYLFAGFRGDGAEGVYFAVSEDGYKWELLNGGEPWVRPQKRGELMRDPHLTRGPDGSFHMVWTWSWSVPAVAGYSSSPDLIQWSEHKMLPVMANYPQTKNVWAPELYYEKDKKRWLMIWSSTALGDKERDHRIYTGVRQSTLQNLTNPLQSIE